MSSRCASLRRARLPAPLAALLLVPGLAACGLIDDVVGGGSRMEETFEYLPAETTRVEFVDRVAIAERLEVGDVDAESSKDELRDYEKAFQREAPAATQLTPWLTTMVRDAAFSDLDVEWEASADFADGSTTVWKMREDLDLDAVADNLLDAEYEESGSSDDVRFFQAGNVKDTGETGLFGDRYPTLLFRVAILPEEHLIVSGGGVERVADVARDDADSVADEGGYDDLVDLAEGPDDVEHAVLSDGDTLCVSGRGPGRRLEGAEDLGTPSGVALFVSDDDPVRAVLRFADDAAAQADADARQSYLDAYTDRFELDVPFEVTTDDSTVIVEIDTDDVADIRTALQRGEGMLACVPEEA